MFRVLIFLVAFSLPALADGFGRDCTARCNDGWTSHSINDPGTCSHHGGVKEWCKPHPTKKHKHR